MLVVIIVTVSITLNAKNVLLTLFVLEANRYTLMMDSGDLPTLQSTFSSASIKTHARNYISNEFIL